MRVKNFPSASCRQRAAGRDVLRSVLGIEGAEDTCLRRERRGCGRQATDLTTSKPTPSGADQTGGVVQLDFDKSVSDGVNIYAKRGDGAEIGLFSDEVVVN